MTKFFQEHPLIREQRVEFLYLKLVENTAYALKNLEFHIFQPLIKAWHVYLKHLSKCLLNCIIVTYAVESFVDLKKYHMWPDTVNTIVWLYTPWKNVNRIKGEKNVNIFGNLPKGVPSYCVVSDALYAPVQNGKWTYYLTALINIKSFSVQFFSRVTCCSL